MGRRRNEADDLVALCEKQGFRSKRTRSGIMVLGKDGKSSVLLHFTPSDHRAYQNTVARLRKIGVKL